VNVKEEFTAADHTGSLTLTHNDRTTVLNGPRRYLNVSLEPVDEFGTGQSIMLRPPVGRSDESMVLEGASPGKYWVHVYSSRGYPASIRSGEVDLQHQPLVVGAGGAAAPIEITMRTICGDQRHGRRRRAARAGNRKHWPDAEPGACLLHSSGG